MSQYFRKPYKPFGGDINVKTELNNYATKVDLHNATEIETSKLAGRADLASLKAEVDKLDIDKLVPVPVDLSKLSGVAKNDVVKTVYDKLVAKVNNISISVFILKTNYDIEKSDSVNKISDTDKKFLILVDLLKNRL